MKIMRTHKIRLNPTPEQDVYFRKCCGICRFSFNWALARWKEQKALGVKECGPMALKKEFNAIKHERFPWVYEVTKCAAETAFFDLASAMKNYYDSKNGKRKGDKIGFPDFKSKKNSKQSFGLANYIVKVKDYTIKIQKLGVVNMSECLRFDGKIMSLRIVKESDGHWYVSICVEMEEKEREKNGNAVGIDLGIKSLAVLSDGKVYENQVLLRKSLAKLKRLNRQLSRRKQGSQRWYKAKEELGKFHAKIANKRKDILHKMTTEITNQYETVIMENLNVAGMVKNHHLALSLSDAALGEIGRQLTYKAQQLVKVDQWFPSSRMCEMCGVKNEELTLADRTFVCPSCGHTEDRDFHAAKNILVQGLRMLV